MTELYRQALLKLPGVTKVKIEELPGNKDWPAKVTITVVRENKIRIISKLEVPGVNVLWEAHREMEAFLTKNEGPQMHIVGIDWGFIEPQEQG